MYRQGLFTGFIISLAIYLLSQYAFDLLVYYAQLFELTPKNTDSIEAGPLKITLSNVTEWNTVFKMMFTILGTYAGIKVINKYIK